MSMNYFDIAVLAIIIICVLIAMKKGLVLAVFDFASWIISICLAGWMYPHVSKFLRTTPLYIYIKQTVIDGMNLSGAVESTTQKLQTELINSLNSPSFLKNLLLANNNPEIHNLLNVSNVEDYIAGYIAGLCMNVVAIVAIIIIVFFIIRVMAAALNIVTMLPVVHSLNRLGGAAIGLLNGTVIVWILLAIATFVVSTETYGEFWQMLESSVIASWFYKTDIILQFISKIR